MRRLIPAALLLAAATVACSSSGGSTATPTSGTSGGGGASRSATTGPATPPEPPRIPRDFTWSGRYVVPDLKLEVPFTWEGRDGNFQMVAGADGLPVHFTNLVSNGTLYTLTYAWPDIPRQPCSNVGPFTLDELNEGLAKAHFVGPEILETPEPLAVDHWRAGVSIELPAGLVPDIPAGIPLRVPIMSGDFYVARDDPTRLERLLHFGFQNLYAVDLDEWILIDEASTAPGQVTLPEECANAPAPSTTAPASTIAPPAPQVP